MSWKIQPVHRVAYIEPTIDSGGPFTGFEEGNIRTLEMDLRCRAANGGMGLAFDRSGASNKGTVNSAALIAHDLTYRTTTFGLWAGATTGSKTTTLVSAAVPSANGNTFYTFSDNSSDHLLAEFGAGGGQVGVLTVGEYFDLGEHIAPQTSIAPTTRAQVDLSNALGERFHVLYGKGAKAITAAFNNVPRATAMTLVDLMSLKEEMRADGDSVSGIGGGGGAQPVVLEDCWGNVYYGPAQVSLGMMEGGTFAQIQINMLDVPRGNV